MAVIYRYYAYSDAPGDHIGNLLCEQREGGKDFPLPMSTPRDGQEVEIPLADGSGWVSGVVDSALQYSRKPDRVFKVVLRDVKPVS